MSLKSSRDVLTREASQPDLVLRYADGEEGVIDVFRPARANGTPDLIILIHGGFWQATIDRMHARPMAEALRDAGYLVAVPEYRRASQDVPGWPHSFGDLRQVVSSLPGLLSAHDLGFKRTLISGHSAGGHLSLLLAGTESHVDGVVALAPVGDLHEAYRMNLGPGVVPRFMGGSPEELPEAYRDADPAIQLANRRLPATVVLQSVHEEIVPVETNRVLEGAEYDLEILEFNDVGHFDFIDPESAVWPEVRDHILRMSSDGT